MAFKASFQRIVWLALLALSACQGRVQPSESSPEAHALRPVSSAKARIVRSGSQRRSAQFQYDQLGRPVGVEHVIEGTTYSYAYELGYAGGARAGSELGSLEKRTTFPDGEQVLRAFDASGGEQLVASRFEVSSRRPSRSGYDDAIVKRQKRNIYGQVEWKEHGNLTRTTYIYNAFRQLRYLLTQNTATQEMLQAFGYHYDTVGRITQVQDFCAQTPQGIVCCDPRDASCTEGPLSTTYAYDAAGTLKQMQSSQGLQTFAVDAVGNLVNKNNHLQLYSDSAHPHAVTEVKDAVSQTVGTYQYNRVGAMLSMQEEGVLTEFAWNANNLPTRTSQQAQTTERFYVGEALYKRLDVFQGQTSTTLFLPGLRIEDGTYRKSYGEEAERESVGPHTRGTLRFFHADHLGSSTLVTDAQGNPIWRAAYFPFGELRFSEGNFTPRKQFTSKEKENLSGLYDFHARLYHPRTGRFLSPDSLMDGLNPYAYVHNNPINKIDPSGHVACDRDASGKCITSEAPVLTWEEPGGAQSPTMQAYQPTWHERAADLVRSAREGMLRFGAYSVQRGFDGAASSGRIVRSGSVDERLDLAGLGVGFMPYFGDYGSLAISGVQLYRHPTGANLVNFGLDGVGAALPLVGALGTIRRIEKRESDNSLVTVVIAFKKDDRFNRVAEKLIQRFVQGKEGYESYTTVVLAHGRAVTTKVDGAKHYIGISANRGVLETPWEVSNWLPAYRGQPGTEKICIYACGIGSTHLPQGLANIRNAPVTVFPGELPKTFNQGVTYLPENYFKKGVRPPPR